MVAEFQSQPGFWGGAWFVFTMPLSALIFLIALFAETNRQPFDMPESEADLVGGFHTEYGAFKWSLFFVAEYSQHDRRLGRLRPPLPRRLESAALAAARDGWRPKLGFAGHPVVFGLVSIVIFLAKILCFIFFFMWVRWTVPRFRYDQVMSIGWQRLSAPLHRQPHCLRAGDRLAPARPLGPPPWPSSRSNASPSPWPSAPTCRRSSAA